MTQTPPTVRSVQDALALPPNDPGSPLYHVASFLGILAGDNPGSPEQAPARFGEAELEAATADASGVGSPAGGTVGPPAGVALGTDGAQSGNWAHDFLAHTGLPLTFSNLKALNAWHQAEGGNAAFNWLNTTQQAPGAGSYNNVGVRNYQNYAQGIDATAQTLFNGHYDNIVAALRAGNDPIAVAQAVADSPWGTGRGVLRVLGAA